MNSAPSSILSSECLLFSETGIPSDVIRVTAHQLPELGPHDVRVRMRYAPVNPADLNFIHGTYGRKPHLPCIPGHEGAGEVEAVGSDVTSLSVGDLVAPLLGAGTWTQHMVAAEHFFALLPPGLDRVQASMLRVNPVTAWLLLQEFATLEPGDWIAQNAANSAVGRCLIQIAKKRGIRTLNFVRRPELVHDLVALGATAVFTDDAEGRDAARAMLQDTPVRIAANCVSGESAIRLMELLSPGGQLITYGAMSQKALKVPNGFLIFKDIHVRGLWVTRWMERASSSELYEVLEPLTEMMAAHELLIPVDEIIPFREATRALGRAAESNRSGKIVLDLA